MDAVLRSEALAFARSGNISVLATVSKTKTATARVMQVVKVDDDFTVWYSSYGASEKLKELKTDPKACIIMNNCATTSDIRLYGAIDILTDQATKEKLWQEEWTRYYPKGKTDPNYVVLKFTADIVEYRNMAKYGMMATRVK
ncbi:MAG: pyridoxamine 5'-phosphate oxidase family protein [Candidatus Omnitrophota bacterium]